MPTFDYMIRNLYFAMGLFLLLLGGQLFGIAELTFRAPDLKTGKLRSMTYQVEEYFPYSILAVGAVVFCLGLRKK